MTENETRRTQDALIYIERSAPRYPEKLLAFAGMPKGLWVKGRLPDPDVPCVAIVGARMCSSYGHEQAYAFGHYLGARGVQVISGMALGIDGYALEGALDAGGSAFAVLGSGADVCYPRSNRHLYARLPERGGILSEQEPGTPPLSFNFPARNRIISALADLVLVVEAKARSGSLITVDFALEQGRTVYAVPGRVGDLLSDGCNRLIAQGAGIAYDPAELLKDLQLLSAVGTAAASSPALGTGAEKAPKAPPKNRSAGKPARKKTARKRPSEGSDIKEAKELNMPARLTLSQTQLRIWDAFQTEQLLTADALCERLDLPAEEVSRALIELTLLGLLRESGRNRYIRL